MTFRHWTPSCQLQPATTLKVWNPSPSNWQHRYLKVSSLQKSKLQPRGMCIYYRTPQSVITGRTASAMRVCRGNLAARESRSLFTHGCLLAAGCWLRYWGSINWIGRKWHSFSIWSSLQSIHNLNSMGICVYLSFSFSQNPTLKLSS